MVEIQHFGVMYLSVRYFFSRDKRNFLSPKKILRIISPVWVKLGIYTQAKLDKQLYLTHYAEMSTATAIDLKAGVLLRGSVSLLVSTFASG